MPEEQDTSLPLPQIKDTPLERFQDHLAQARDIIVGKGKGSSFPPESTTVGQLLLALEALAPLVQGMINALAVLGEEPDPTTMAGDLVNLRHDLDTSTRKSVEEDAKLRNRLLELEQRVPQQQRPIDKPTVAAAHLMARIEGAMIGEEFALRQYRVAQADKLTDQEMGLVRSAVEYAQGLDWGRQERPTLTSALAKIERVLGPQGVA